MPVYAQSVSASLLPVHFDPHKLAALQISMVCPRLEIKRGRVGDCVCEPGYRNS